MSMMTMKPEILARKPLAHTKLFNIEQVSLRFSNQQEVEYERFAGGGQAVMVLPVTDNNEILLVHEYAVGREDYEIGLVRGRVDDGETPEQAAQREMREEVQFAAKRLQYVRSFYNAPHYSSSVSHLFFAYDLYESALLGDEAEPLGKIYHPIDDIDALFNHDKVNDARTLLALILFNRSQSR